VINEPQPPARGDRPRADSATEVPGRCISLYLGLLSGQVRLEILRSLAEGPCTVTRLAEQLGVSVPLVSHNLRKLLEAGLVHVQPRARMRIYRLDGALAAGIEEALAVSLDLRDGWTLRLQGPARSPGRTCPRPVHRRCPQEQTSPNFDNSPLGERPPGTRM